MPKTHPWFDQPQRSIQCKVRQLRHALGGLLIGVLIGQPLGAAAKTGTEAPLPPFELKGTSLDGRVVDSGQLRGKVVMVFYWNTSCRVCMQKMAELRANAAGWRGKPFELILVSTDAQRQDVLTHARLVRLIDAGASPMSTLWMGDADYRDTLVAPPKRLPLTLVLNVQGAVAARHEGRIAPEAWDAVADLLP